MKPRHQVSRAAIDLIKRFEGYRPAAARAPDGRWTIGYGHTQTAREGAEVSESDAEALLVYDLIAVAHAINEWTYTPLTQNEFDALASFAFNIGLDAFRDSAVLRRLNEGQHLQAACAMELWRRAEVDGESPVIDALVRRRAAEKSLFLTPPGDWVPAPSSILKPQLDLDLAGAVPGEPPSALAATPEGELVLLRRDEAAFAGPTPAQEPHLPEPEPDSTSEPGHPAPPAAEAVSSHLATILRETEADAGPAEPPAPAAANDSVEPPAAHAPGPVVPTPPPPLSWRALAPLVGMAALGLGLFVGGLYWAFRIAPSAGLSPPLGLAAGWVAGLAGVAFFSVAAYRLFERLGRADEPLAA